MWAVQGWLDLAWKILAKVYSAVYSQAVIWSRFLMQFQLYCWRGLYIHATLFFCKWWQYSSFASEDNQISRACQWEGGWYKTALCTCDSANRSQGIKTKISLLFLLHAVQTPCFVHQNCSKELFSTIVFRFFDSRAYINYTENFMVFSTLTPSSHDRLRTRLRTFLRLRTCRVSQLN